MAKHEFHRHLAAFRESSRWPNQDDFARRVGVSPGGYKKYELGERIPDAGILTTICARARADKAVEEELHRLRDEAKAVQAGIQRSFSSGPPVDADKLAAKLQKEALYVLKQAGVKVTDSAAKVMRKRITMILKSALGE